MNAKWTWNATDLAEERTIARSSDDENIYDRIVVIPMMIGPCSDCESDDDRGDKGQHTRSLHFISVLRNIHYLQFPRIV